jgi:hypothetical protein
METNINKIKQKYIDGILHTLCGCGVCGKYFASHKNNGTEVRFIKGHYCIGKHPSEASKEKNRLAHTGRISTFKDKKHTIESIEKIKIARSRQVMVVGRHHTEESKEKNRVAHLGTVQTIESNIKRSLALTGVQKTNEHRLNIGNSKTGEKNPHWLGGISKLPYSQDWTRRLRDSVRQRDNYTCQVCGLHQDSLRDMFHKRLDVHHINYDKKNCSHGNLITLCHSCHIKTNDDRENWMIYFNKQEMIAV